MTDIQKILSNLRRPGLLIRAARHGVGHYSREKSLGRLLGTPRSGGPEETVKRLIETEAVIEDERLNGHANYSVALHVECLIALIAETRLLARQYSAES